MSLDSKKALRMARAILAGDVEIKAPRRKMFSGLPMFLLGVGSGVALGLIFAPGSGEEIRTQISDRARQGMDMARNKGQELTQRAKDVVNRGKEVASETADSVKQKYQGDKTNVS